MKFIKNYNELIISIDIDLISKYLNYFIGCYNFNNTIFISPLELINFIYLINFEKIQTENIIKKFNNNFINDNLFISYLKLLKFSKVIHIHDTINDNNIKIILKNFIINHILTLNPKRKLKIIMLNNIKYVDITYYNNILDKKEYNDIYKYYKYLLLNLIDNKKLYADHIAFSILFINDDIINSIFNRYFKYSKLLDNNLYKKELLKILFKNQKFVANYINTYIYISKSNYNYIYKIHNNNINNILSLCDKKNYILLFRNNIFRIEILNKYINNLFIDFKLKDIFTMINDEKIPEYLIKSVILKNYDYTLIKNNILLKEIYEFYNNINYDLINIRHKNIKKFVFDIVYEKLKNTSKYKDIVNEFLKKTNILNYDLDYYFIKDDHEFKINKFFDILSFDDKINFIFILASKQIIFLDNNLILILKKYIKDKKIIINFIDILTSNIIFNLRYDIYKSNLQYILNTKNKKDNLHLFDNINFKTNYINNNFNFVLTEYELNYFIKNVKNNNYNLLFRIALYAIRYNYLKSFKLILKKTNKKILDYEDYIHNSKERYKLIDYAFTKEIIIIINNI